MGHLVDVAAARPWTSRRSWRSGRDLRSHEAADADWAARGGDAVNDEALADWRAKSIDEVRQEFARVAGELRGFLTVVPETRWVKDAGQQQFFYEETIEHYDDHQADLAAILDAAGIG